MALDAYSKCCMQWILVQWIYIKLHTTTQFTSKQYSVGCPHGWHWHVLVPPAGFQEFANRVIHPFPAPDCFICLIIFFTQRSEGEVSSGDNWNGHTGASWLQLEEPSCLFTVSNEDVTYKATHKTIYSMRLDSPTTKELQSVFASRRQTWL